MAIKKVTQADRLRFQMTASMYQVMELLKVTRLNYCDFKYETGLLYLRLYLRGDVFAIEEMEESAAFWGWWKMQWHLRDEEFLKRMGKRVMVGWDLRVAYKQLHSPVDLLSELNPYGKVMEDSYCKDLVPSIIKD